MMLDHDTLCDLLALAAEIEREAQLDPKGTPRAALKEALRLWPELAATDPETTVRFVYRTGTGRPPC
jgi:hypothetical protein